MKKILVFILFYAIVSCSTNQKNIYFDMIKGEWSIEKFCYKNEDLTLKRYDVIGFENHNHLRITKRDNSEIRSVSSDYKVFKDINTLRINIRNCEEKRFDGIYNMHIDTIQDTGESYIIQLSLDNEDTYIEAMRSMLKYNTPQEYEESLKR
ncbi:hypothetical protein OIU80_11685 [Flavobacterium sp. LS1R47]|uniref:Lipocalin-like domain-containing protein n=1 Tax=Flavobacterium frigoritolerans TaxID=2987686 RepID=A0A9X2ZQQ8_9FLAO|nr:hypothetical protein [Flavobacterium frigoritolerans]MCV9932942.1 hypothetical protein [Flavobacterium frigoritolerans]